MSRRSLWFWKGLHPLVRRASQETGLSVNRLVNMAVSRFLGASEVLSEELQLLGRREALLREEGELRRVCTAILRSGAYLDDYAHKVLQQPSGQHGCTYPKSPSLEERTGQPRRVLRGKEKAVVRRILARREAIAKELLEIEDQLLPKKRYRLKCSRSRVTKKRKQEVS